MTLSGQIANKEIYNFLRTATIKCSYFADQSKKRHVRANADAIMADNELPYYKHMAGEYILKDKLVVTTANPQTGLPDLQIYGNTCMTLNEAGEQIIERENRLVYDSSAFDEMMYVTSLDTKETIPFTLQNLHKEYALDNTAVHEKTLEAYKLPSRYYELLCERYPKQVDLIKAIVYPIESTRPLTEDEIYKMENWGRPAPDIFTRRRDYLVQASNFQILNYDDTILAENERSNLTTEMQALVNVIKDRWYVKEYTIEENYALVLWSVLWCALPLGLIAQRYANIRSPFAHDSHVWDFLTSKGLSSYKGYLNLEQTLFLYKNIEYILRNRGKQEVTNILIDNLLNKVGLDIKSKTIVLDTTDVLDEEHRVQALSCSSQCETCTKRTWCHQNITDYDCPDRQAIDDLCKPKPIVLTEEFAGASKEKVIKALTGQYGYTAEQAAEKYDRAMLWKDDEVEAIKEAYNRNQMTDLSGVTEELDTVIKREYKCGLEPEYNDNVVDQQFNDLRHINGTYAPTKLLEITKRTYNARFSRLFSKFLTETLLHLCPKNVDGVRTNKVLASYSISVQSDTGDYVLDFGEMVAALYFGYTREFNIEVLFDYIRPEFGPNAETTFKADEAYYSIIDRNEVDKAKNASLWTNANRIKRLTEGTKEEVAAGLKDYYVGQTIFKEVYRWAPKINTADDILGLVEGHELLTNNLATPTFDFPVPDQIRLNNTFKFGKPVKQIDLCSAWDNDIGEYIGYLAMCPGAKKVLKIGDILYGVTDEEITEADTDWIWYKKKLVILGEIKDNIYYANNDEIPLIPRYFRWYGYHISPTSIDGGSLGANANTQVFPDDHNHIQLYGIDGEEPEEAPTTELLKDMDFKRCDKFSALGAKGYKTLEIERYFPVNSVIDQYVDLMEVITDPKAVGVYLTKQFTILEQIYCYAAQSQDAVVHRAACALLNAILIKDTYYKVDLTGTIKGTKWPPEGASKYGAPQVDVATYNDWLKTNQELRTAFETVDKSSDSVDIWDAFNTRILEKLTVGCTLNYLSAAIDTTTMEKLKELVTRLSSYKVAFMNVDPTESSCDTIYALVSALLSQNISYTSHDYIMPILDAPWRPRAGGYMSDNGLFYAYTHDTKASKSGVYYTAHTTIKSTCDYGKELEEMDIDSDVLTFVRAELTPGTVLDPYKYFEKIDLYNVLGITDREKRIEISRGTDRKWYYRLGMPVTINQEVPASEADYTNGIEYDTFLENGLITKEIRANYKCRKYRKTVQRNDYVWGEMIQSDILAYWLETTVTDIQVRDTTNVTVKAYDEIHAISEIVETGEIKVNPGAQTIKRGGQIVYEQTEE